jgi:hypothetical protein
VNLATEIERAVATLEKSTAHLATTSAEAGAAAAVERAATAAYDTSGADADLEHSTKERIRRERADRLVVAATEAQTSARRALDALERRAQCELLARSIERANAVVGHLADPLAELLDLHRQAEAVVERAATLLAQHEADRREGAILANALNESGSFSVACPARAIANVRAAFASALALAAETENRADISGWLTMPPPAPKKLPTAAEALQAAVTAEAATALAKQLLKATPATLHETLSNIRSRTREAAE